MSQNLAQRPRMVLISDVSLGYGTPQLLHIARSFAEQLQADVYIFEPDQSERPPVNIQAHVSSKHVFLKRLYSSAHPYTHQGRSEFVLQLARELTELQPDILLFSTMYGIAVLDRIRLPQAFKIFYCLEDVDPYYSYLFPLVKQFDLILFPEENRRRIYLDRLGGLSATQSALVLYNASGPRPTAPASERNGRLFYGGNFHKDKTLARHFLEPGMTALPIDVYGIVDGFPDNEAVIRQMSGEHEGINFCGYHPADEKFYRNLSAYQYSIVIWNPDREDYFYAAPNKFFDAIACGVPPIAAPHPQCVEIIRRWHCGILMDDWSLKSVRKALNSAMEAAGSAYYGELVDNCRRAMEQELSWDRQFEKLHAIMRRRMTTLRPTPNKLTLEHD